MVTAYDALNILGKCNLRSATRMQNPGKYNFSIEYSFSDIMDYDKLVRQLESLGMHSSARRTGIIYTGGDFEVSLRRPGSAGSNFGHVAQIALLLPEGYVKLYEQMHEKVASR